MYQINIIQIILEQPISQHITLCIHLRLSANNTYLMHNFKHINPFKLSI